MAKLYTAKDIEKLLAAGKRPEEDAVLTPGARDLLRDARLGGARPGTSGSAAAAFPGSPRAASLPPGVPPVPPEPIVPSALYEWIPGADPQSPEEIQQFFYSPEIQDLKRQLIRVAHKMWARSMVDGNGGNITWRVGDNLVLCTPTLKSKGELTEDDLALVDLDGVQKAGWRKRTSECNTHLAIMKAQPLARSVIHGHPPHSTAFAVAGIEPPTCLCSEAEIFTGAIRLIPYETPGSPENAVAVAAVAKDNPAVLLANHGVMTWGSDAEDAYWKLENMETACQTIWIASQLNGGKLNTISAPKMKEIFAIREMLGMKDPRADLEECELCHNNDLRPGAVCDIAPRSSPATGVSPGAGLDPEAEKLVQALTDQIMVQR